MISKVVPSGRGLSIALRDWADPCDYPKLGWLERIIFDSGDERSRRPCALKTIKNFIFIYTQRKIAELFHTNSKIYVRIFI